MAEQIEKSHNELQEEIVNLRAEISSLRQIAQNAETRRAREAALASKLAADVCTLESNLEICKTELAKVVAKIGQISQFVTKLYWERWPFCTKDRVQRAIRFMLN